MYERWRLGGELPCAPQWYCEISSGSETETRSVIPATKRAAARNARGCDLSAKARVYGCRKMLAVLICRLSSLGRERRAMPIASPIINTSDWSAMEDGDVRKKKARVMWKREMELMMVAPDMRPMAAAVEELSDDDDDGEEIECFESFRVAFGQQPGYMMCLMGSPIVSLVARSPHAQLNRPHKIFRRFCFSGSRGTRGASAH